MPEAVFGVILVNWNGYDDTERALESLVSADPPPAHVVVVDNGSADGSTERLRQWTARHASRHPSTDAGSPSVTIVDVRENRGFAGGNNIGLAELARLEVTHFLLLNNDAMVAQDYFARMNDALRSHPDAALVGCAIFYHPDRSKVWFAGGREIPWRALMLHHYELPESPEPRETPFVTGCAMLISRSLYDAEGGLAECYNPIYWEDTDYSHRARSKGWKVMLVPQAKVFHRVGSSFGGEKLTPPVAFWQNRNRGYYVRRNYRGFDRAAAIAYLVATKPAKALLELMRGRSAMASAIFRGFVTGLKADCH